MMNWKLKLSCLLLCAALCCTGCNETEANSAAQTAATTTGTSASEATTAAVTTAPTEAETEPVVTTTAVAEKLPAATAFSRMAVAASDLLGVSLANNLSYVETSELGDAGLCEIYQFAISGTQQGLLALSTDAATIYLDETGTGDAYCSVEFANVTYRGHSLTGALDDAALLARAESVAAALLGENESRRMAQEGTVVIDRCLLYRYPVGQNFEVRGVLALDDTGTHLYFQEYGSGDYFLVSEDAAGTTRTDTVGICSGSGV